jgi:AcrR family transcriptional regulator
MRLKPEVRKDAILDAAVQLALDTGLSNVRLIPVAERAGVTNGLVSHYFGTVKQLHRAVVRHAIHREILPIVAQALAAGDSDARKAPDDVKSRALASLML